MVKYTDKQKLDAVKAYTKLISPPNSETAL